jgi:uncharacterized protein YoxC
MGEWERSAMLALAVMLIFEVYRVAERLKELVEALRSIQTEINRTANPKYGESYLETLVSSVGKMAEAVQEIRNQQRDL